MTIILKDDTFHVIMRMGLNKNLKASCLLYAGFPIMLSALALLSACAALFSPAPTPLPPLQSTLQALGPQDQWHLIYLKDQPAGLSHFTVKPKSPDGTYQIESFLLLRFTLLGMQQEISWKSREWVGDDLNLQGFIMEGKQEEDILSLKGTVREGVLYLDKNFRGQKEQLRLSLSSPLKASLAQYFLPLLVGSSKGLTMTLAVFQFNPQDFVGTLTITLEDQVMMPSGKAAFKIKNQLLGVTSYSMVSPRGEVLEEQMLGGLIRSEKITSRQAQSFILEQSLAKTDLLLDFSLVPADKKINHPQTLKSLTLKLEGVEFKTLPQDDRQKIVTGGEETKDSLTLKIEKETGGAPLAEKADKLAPYLSPNAIIQSRDPQITARAKEIVGPATDPLKKARLLHSWVFNHLKKSFRESYTSREVLEVMEGECQSHAKLYAALVRSVGLPAKVVIGLVYVPDLGKNGFLYHAWNEVYIGRWVAVDPALGQFPADVTHIKLAEGEGLKDMAAIAATVGKLRIKIVGEEKSEP